MVATVRNASTAYVAMGILRGKEWKMQEDVTQLVLVTF